MSGNKTMNIDFTDVVSGDMDYDMMEQLQGHGGSSSGSSIASSTNSVVSRARSLWSVGRGLVLRAVPSTRRESVWGAVTAVLFCIVLAQAGRHRVIQYVHVHNKSATTSTGSYNGNDVCLTPACVTLASSLVHNMNRTVDPCDDFYEYACGGWTEDHPIPDSKSQQSPFSILGDRNLVTLRRLLATSSSTLDDTVTATGNSSSSSSALSATEKARSFYRSCTDTDTIESLGVVPLHELVSSLFSSTWKPTKGLDHPPLLDDHHERNHFSALLARLHLVDVSPFFTAAVTPDDRESSRNVLRVGQAGLTLPSRDYYVDRDVQRDEALTALHQHIARTFDRYDVDSHSESGGSADARAAQVVLFESHLADVMATTTELRDPEKTYNVKTVQEDLDGQFKFGWSAFFEHLDVNVTSVVVDSPAYLSGLDALLQITTSRVILDFLTWKVLSSFSHHLSQAYVDEDFHFAKTIQGVQSPTIRWKTCVARTDATLGFALGKLFVDDSFGGSSRDEAVEIIADLVQAFEQGLNDVKWMDDFTKAKARGKAAAIVHKVGWPEKLSTNTALNHYYEKIDVKATQYFHNILQSRRVSVSRNLADLVNPVDRSEWHMTPTTINAYYNPPNNEMVFPAAILQPPFFDKDYPRAANYGGIGVVIGHELTHGFDDQGSRYDSQGNMSPWWSDKSTKSFQERTDCMVDQYAKYGGDDNVTKVNGKLTLGENIADNGGLTHSFRAYRNWVETRKQDYHGGEEPRLPGLMELSQNQLFFLSFAGMWCENVRPEASRQRLLTDPHSPGKYRIVGTLSNSEDFAREFQCAKGSRMNPRDKCKVW